jgi:hypothetical protein
MAQEVSVPTSTATADRADLEDFIDQLDITDVQKRMLRGRWLDQVAYMGRKANQARRRYYWLRSVGVIAAVTVPAFISLNLAYNQIELRLATFFASLLVALIGAAELLLRYGERWRHYRRNEEMLKSEGWQYLMGIGPYGRAKSPQHAYKMFSSRVESILQQDVEGYMESVAKLQEAEKSDVFTNV